MSIHWKDRSPHDHWWDRPQPRRKFPLFQVDPTFVDPRLEAASKAMHDAMMERVRHFIEIVDAWLLLMTARYGVLPEEIRERCVLEVRPRVMGKDHILHVDGSVVECLEERYSSPVHDDIEITFTSTHKGISPLITAEMLYPRFWKYPKSWRGQ